MTTDFGRLLTAIVTPFERTPEQAINWPVLQKVVDHLINSGNDGLVVVGTTGESPTLTHDEDFIVFTKVKEFARGRVKLVAGTGSNSTRTTIESTQKAEKLGYDGAMVVVPYYNKPSQEGQYQHFKAVAEATKLPIIVYNIPGRTGVNMLPETLARLAAINNIVAVKEASGNLDQVAEVRKVTPPEFIIYSGDDNLTLPIMDRGGHGVISVAAHVIGKEIKAMINLYVSGNKAEAYALHEKLMPVFKNLFITTNPTPVKAALCMIGLDVGTPRLPLIEATTREKEIIREALDTVR